MVQAVHCVHVCFVVVQAAPAHSLASSALQPVLLEQSPQRQGLAPAVHGGQQGGQPSAAAPPPAAAAPGGPALRQPSRHPPPPALPIPISEPAAPNLAEATCPFARVGACPEINPCMACRFAVADDLRCCCLVHGSALQQSCFIPIQCLLAAAAVPNPAAKTAAAKAADDNFADVLAGTGVDEEAEQAALTAAVSARALGPGAPLPAAALPPPPPLFSQDAFLSQLVRAAKKPV